MPIGIRVIDKISEQSDVAISSLQDSQVFVYNLLLGKWENKNLQDVSTFTSSVQALIDSSSIPVGNVTGLGEFVSDSVSTLIQNGTGISWAYNDTNNTLTPTVSLSSFTTSDITEGSNLYFNNSRAINSTLTGYVSGAGTITSSDTILTAIQKLNGNLLLNASGVSSFNTRTGDVTLTSGDVTGALGFTPYNSTNPNNYITSSSLSSYLTISSAASTYQPIGDYVPYTGGTGAINFGGSLMLNGPISGQDTNVYGAIADALVIRGGEGTAGSNGGGNLTLRGGNSFTGDAEPAGDAIIKGGINTFSTTTGGYVRIFTLDIERITVRTDGNVGINNNNPSELLDINGNVNLQGLFKLDSSSGTTGQVFTSNGSSNPTWENVSFTNLADIPTTLSGYGITDAVSSNSAITGSTRTKITYDSKGLVTAGVDATTADISDSTNRRYVTDAQLTVISNTSGTNTGDQTTITGNAGSATVLQTGRTIGITGDATWTSPSFNGSSNVTAALTLATVNSNVGSFGSASVVPVITVNGKGLITAVSTGTITPVSIGAQASSSNLTSLAALSYVSASFVKMTSSGTFSLDTNTYLTGNQTITLSGDLSGSGTTAITTTIGSNRVTLGMMAQVSSGIILGRSTASTGNVETIIVQAPLTISGGNLDFDETVALGNNARVAIAKSGTTTGTRRRINFIEGTNVSITLSDDGAGEKVDVTIAATAGSGGYSTVQEEGSDLTARSILNFIGAAVTAADDGSSKTNITFDAGLNALATYNTNGFLVQTANNTFAGRTLTAGSSKITISNGDGVSANPTVDVSEGNVTHNNLGGLTTGDPHTQYVYLSPGNGSRNVISMQGSASILGLGITGLTSPSGVSTFLEIKHGTAGTANVLLINEVNTDTSDFTIGNTTAGDSGAVTVHSRISALGYVTIAPITAGAVSLIAKTTSASFGSAHNVFAVQTSGNVDIVNVYRSATATYVLRLNTNAGSGTVGFVRMDSFSGRTTGYINTSAGVSGNGGSIDTYGNLGAGGSINTSGAVGSGGSISTFGSSSGNGGSITTNAGSTGGGSINTSDGGGSINTTGNGSIQFGIAANRITIQGVSGAAGKTLTLPNLTGTVIGAASTSTTDTHIAMATTTAGGIKFVALSNDATISNTGALTISSNAVTLAKFQQIATASILGRSTGGTGDIEVLSVSTVRTLLSINNVENTALSTWTGSTNLTTLGTITTGTWSGNTILPSRGGTGVSNNDASTLTISGNFATTFTISNITNLTLPTTGTLATLAGSESLTNKKLGSLTSNGFVKTSGGDGTLSVDTNTYLTGNQTITLSGDLSGSGTTSISATISNNVVSFAKMQTISTGTLLGRSTASTGNVEQITVGSGLSLSGGTLTATGGGTGTVTSVSVTTANGVSGSVANDTTTPAITLTLGNITPSTVNGLTLTSQAVGFTIAGGTTSKTLTVSNTLTFAGTDSSTLNIGVGGTLGSAAFVSSSSFEVPLTFGTGLTRTVNTVTVNAIQNITKLSNLASNGFVKTSGGDGTLSVDTNTYLTGNQTITLSGDLSGSGTTSISATISNNTVSFAKMQTISTNRLLGRFTAGSGNIEQIAVGSGLSLSGGTLSATGGGGGGDVSKAFVVAMAIVL